jgi:hypothetical protein
MPWTARPVTLWVRTDRPDQARRRSRTDDPNRAIVEPKKTPPGGDTMSDGLTPDNTTIEESGGETYQDLVNLSPEADDE